MQHATCKTSFFSLHGIVIGVAVLRCGREQQVTGRVNVNINIPSRVSSLSRDNQHELFARNVG